MDGSADDFDVVAVVGRAVSMHLPTASVAELGWADRASDRVRQWVDAWQAAVHHEQTLPRPLPPVEHPFGGGSTGQGWPGSGAPSADGAVPVDAPPDDGAAGYESPDSPVPGAGGDAESAPGAPGDAGAGETLPSLGAGWAGQESAVERERKARRAWLLSRLGAFAEALRVGRVTTGHVDTLAAAADRLPDTVCDRLLGHGEALLPAALGMSPERFSRFVQRQITLAYEAEGVDRTAALRRRSSLRRGVDGARGCQMVCVRGRVVS